VLQGRIVNIRELQAVTFVILQDFTGTIQTVWKKLPA
jgi:aspartyl/asparaginyl-tRNA synthetase